MPVFIELVLFVLRVTSLVQEPTCECDVTVGLASRVLGYALVVAKVIAVNPGDVELHAHLYGS